MCFIMPHYGSALSIISIMEDCEKSDATVKHSHQQQQQYYNKQALIDSEGQMAFLLQTLVYLDDYKWMLSTMMLSNAPQGVTESLF